MILYVITALLILFFWAAIFRRWQHGVIMLLCYLPFAGAVTLALYPSAIPNLFKDFFFVIPSYIAFFLSRRIKTSEIRMPASIILAMLALAVLVFIQMFNPNMSNWLVAAIGAKVWLFYLPIPFLAFSMLKTPEDLIRILRMMVVITWVPCCIGILQWMSSMSFGYRATMEAFYGAAALGATQEFTSFAIGGSFFRIPSTFTFVTQYFGYTLAMIVPAYALMKMERSRKWHVFATATLILVITASFMSGARTAYLFVPIMLALVYLLEGKFVELVKITIALPIILLSVLYVTGIDLVLMYNLMLELTGNYFYGVAQQGLLDAIKIAPFGMGTGTNTGPARFALDDPNNLNAFIAIENYYAKAVYELGVIGLVIVAALFLIIMSHGFRIHQRIQVVGLKSCSAAFLAFIITMAINSFKGWQIDLDPINVYFWVFSGFLLKLGYLDKLLRFNMKHSQARIKEYREPSVELVDVAAAG